MDTVVVDWIRQRTRAQMVLAFFCCIMIGAGLAIIVGRTQVTYWIVFGGNTDPGDGNGGGQARGQFVGGGWVSDSNIFQVTWQANIGADTTTETNDAMTNGHKAFEAHCRVNRCIIAGFSLGNSPALQLAKEVGQPPSQTYLFGAPQPSTGVFHNFAPDSPFVNPFLQAMGGLNMMRPVYPGMQAFYDTHDPYANAAPQCSGPGLFALSVNPGHRIISQDEAQQHIWTGTDGVIMHEANYVAPPGLPRSGSDRSQLFDGCPASGWENQPGEVPAPVPGGTGPSGPAPSVGNQPPLGPAPNPGAPQPFRPDIPGGSPIPSSDGHMPTDLPIPTP